MKAAPSAHNQPNLWNGVKAVWRMVTRSFQWHWALLFIDDGTENRSSHINSEANSLLKVNKWNHLEWQSQSPDRNPIEHAFLILNTQLKTERHINK